MLATRAPQLTLNLLKEWIIVFSKADMPQKTACLHYVAPWLSNLDLSMKPSQEDATDKIKQVENIIRSLISITVAERGVGPSQRTRLIGLAITLGDCCASLEYHSCISRGVD